LGQGQLVLLALDRDGQQGVRVLQRLEGVVEGQRQVVRGLAVPVEDGGDVAGAAQLAGRALAELAALLGDEADLVGGHGGSFSWGVPAGSGPRSAVASTWDAARTGRRRVAHPPGDTASITDHCNRAASLAEATR